MTFASSTARAVGSIRGLRSPLYPGGREIALRDGPETSRTLGDPQSRIPRHPAVDGRSPGGGEAPTPATARHPVTHVSLTLGAPPQLNRDISSWRTTD